MKTEMVWYKEICLMRFYFILVLLFASAYYSDAQRKQDNDKIKSMIISEIMKKISNITLNSLSKAPDDKKVSILNKIENKLKRSAEFMGPDGAKYVKYIMDEFKTKTFDEPISTPLPTVEIRKSNDVINVKLKQDHSDTHLKPMHEKRTSKIAKRTGREMDPQTKQEIIIDISNKIQYLAKGLIKNASTEEEKKAILEKIKKKIIDSAKEKHKEIHAKHEELKTYSSLIAQGIEESMRSLLGQHPVFENGRRTGKYTDTPTDIHNIFEIDNKNDPEMDQNIFTNYQAGTDNEDLQKYRDILYHAINGRSKDPRCNAIVNQTCNKIQSFTKIPCGEGKTIDIEHLCNGVIDCINQIDETNCSLQAINKIREATKVMSEIDTTLDRKCFLLNGDNNVLTAQNQILKEVLQTQLQFLQKNVAVPLLFTKPQVVNEIFLKKAVTDVSTILSTLSIALDGTLCDYHHEEDEELEILEAYPNLKWSPKSCTCNLGFCVSPDCETPCKRICWQKHSLNHWGCTSINGGTSVTLNAICDGKLDCFDESDETLCTADANVSKFEARNLYSIVLDFIASKSKSSEFANVRNKLLTLHGLVRQLQKHTMKTNTDDHLIQTIRNDAFKLLVLIYEDYILMSSVSRTELDDLYLHLLSINEKIVHALKRSHTGNENSLSPGGCYCRSGLCALRRCSKSCIQACLAEPVLTRFSCNSTNTSVPLQSICNGINNCLGGEDEQNCKKEVCRGHHFVVLRHNIENVGVKHRYTGLGEILETWKNKVSAMLFVAESSVRPNKNSMVELISRILHDLVVAFAALEEPRRISTEFALREFKQVSNIVMDTLKAC